MKKRVIIHIGFHKTGSSALQAFLTQNVAALAVGGVDYPYPEPDSVVAAGGCSGNLMQILYRDGFMDGFRRGQDHTWQRVTPSFIRRIREVVDSSPHDTVIFSSEMLSNVPQEVVSGVLAALNAHDVSVVCFVRDPFDFAYSCWRQVVKTSARRKRSFNEYLSRVPQTHRGLSMFQGFPRYVALGVPLTVLRYETHRKNVAKAFLAATGLTSVLADHPITSEREVNRSLTGSEAAMTCLLAKRHSPDFVATYIRSALTRDGRDSVFYDRASHRMVLDWFAGPIAQINERLPEAERLSTVLRDEPDTPLSIEPGDVELYLNLLEQHPLPSRTARMKLTLHPVLNWARRSVGLRPALPPDFDGEAYLFHNPDVAAANMDPVKHYLAAGHAEDRRYRFN